MPGTTWKVECHRVAIAANVTVAVAGTEFRTRGYVACIGADDARLALWFVDEGDPVPEPAYDAETRRGTAFLPATLLGAVLDVLKDLSPVYAYVNAEMPIWNGLRTSEDALVDERM